MVIMKKWHAKELGAKRGKSDVYDTLFVIVLQPKMTRNKNVRERERQKKDRERRKVSALEQTGVLEENLELDWWKSPLLTRYLNIVTEIHSWIIL